MIAFGRLAERDLDSIVAIGGDAERGRPSFWRGRLADQASGRLIALVARDGADVA